jgi:acyl carrier protein
MLQSLPLNRNGKVDLYALSQLRDEERLEVPELDGPRNPTEEELRKIWIDVLRKESIGINDDFFEIGGHSLLAIRVMTAIRDVFRVQLPLFTFLENPTIAGLAARIGEHPITETEEQQIEQLLRELNGMSGEAVDKLMGEPDEVAPEAQGSTD